MTIRQIASAVEIKESSLYNHYENKVVNHRDWHWSNKHAEKRGFKWVVLVGGDYYTQFGFEAGF